MGIQTMVNFQLRRSCSTLAFSAITFLAFVALAKSAAISSEDEAFRNFLGHRRLATRAAWPADAGTMIRVLKRNGNEVAEPQDNMEWHRLLELMAAEQNQANGGQTSEYSHKFPMKLGKRTPPLLRQYRAVNSPMYIRSS